MRNFRKTLKGIESVKRNYLKAKNTMLYEAKKAVYKAVRSGRLPRVKTLQCVDCKSPATCYDHRDYFKFLDVEPVCHRCNKIRGPGINNRTL